MKSDQMLRVSVQIDQAEGLAISYIDLQWPALIGVNLPCAVPARWYHNGG